MRQIERKREKDKVAIALVLCFCVIALTSVFTIRANLHKIQGSGRELPVSDPAPSDSLPSVEEPPQETPAVNDPPVQETGGPLPTVDSLDEPAADKPCRFPVNAAEAYVSNEFAMDHLIYSVTLDQYMVHCGIDIEAPQDTQVVAIQEGTVTAVYTDDRYGNAVEVDHNGFVAIYANLSDASMVETGDTVEAGQIIGGVGSTGLFESLEPAHLHLMVLVDGVYADPTDYLP